jgi:hypothetical protein
MIDDDIVKHDMESKRALEMTRRIIRGSLAGLFIFCTMVSWCCYVHNDHMRSEVLRLTDRVRHLEDENRLLRIVPAAE